MTTTEITNDTTYRILPAPMPLVLPHGYTVSEAFHVAAERIWATAETKVRDLVTRHPGRFPLYTQKGTGLSTQRHGRTGARVSWVGNYGYLPNTPVIPGSGDRPRSTAPISRTAKTTATSTTSTSCSGRPGGAGTRQRATRRRTTSSSTPGAPWRCGSTTRAAICGSFLAPDSLFIDIMMNVGIIFHSAQETGDPGLARIAIEHCLTTRRTLVRGDGSASHEGIFDLDTGQFLRQTTQQGWRDDASWARGQGWAMYGFGTAYRYTGDRRFLDTAIACADFYRERTSDRLVPAVEYLDEPSPDAPYESSAAAIAADAFWQLAGLVQDEVKARAYADYAVQILVRLASDDFLAFDDSSWEERPQTRDLSRNQEPRCRRVRHVGRLLVTRRGRHDRANCASSRPGGQG